MNKAVLIMAVVPMLPIVLGQEQCESETSTYSIDESLQYTFAAHGGGGGEEFSYNCPNDYVIVSVSGTAADRLDSIQFECREFLEDGTIGSATAASQVFGGSGGQAFSGRCPADEMMNFGYGRSGSRIDEVGFGCGDVSMALGGGSSTTLGPWGGTGGSAFSDSCPPGYLLTGIDGRAAEEVDNIQFTCSAITVY